jgi:hypothetical protein
MLHTDSEANFDYNDIFSYKIRAKSLKYLPNNYVEGQVTAIFSNGATVTGGDVWEKFVGKICIFPATSMSPVQPESRFSTK